MSEVALLFYSNYCNICKSLLTEFQKTPVQKSIKFICIDPENIRKKLPPYVKSVPTLVTTKQLVIGTDISRWLKQTATSNIKNVNKSRDSNTTVKQTGDDIGGYQPCEMNSNYSDNYSFIDIDASAKGTGGTTITHNFHMLDYDSQVNNGSLKIPGGPPGPPTAAPPYNRNQSGLSGSKGEFNQLQNKEDTDFMNKKMEEFIASRENDVPNVPARI